MTFPDSSKKAPNIFIEVSDTTGSPAIITSSGTSFGPIIVNPPPPVQIPVVDFVGDLLSGDVPLSVNFTDLSTNSPTSWVWDFGDGSPLDFIQNPTHIYTTANIYTVTLTATNETGSGSLTKIDYIIVTASALPEIRWYPNDTLIPLTLSNPTTIGITF